MLIILFLSHSYFLLPPPSATLSYPCAANDNNPNSPFMPYYAVFMSFWATLFLEFWKRKENYAAMKWGTEVRVRTISRPFHAPSSYILPFLPLESQLLWSI